MTRDLAFLRKGEPLPVDVEGRDVDGRTVRLGDVLARHERVLLYFYPFDARAEPPAAWRRLERERDGLARAGVAVVGVRGPPLATRLAAPLDDLAFPLIEDANYSIGQAVGVLGGRRGDDIATPEVPRALVLLDGEGRVVAARRGDDEAALADVLGDR